MKVKLLLTFALLLSGFSAPVFGQLLNGDFSQGGANWDWFAAVSQVNCANELASSSERVASGLALVHPDEGGGVGTWDTCGSIRQNVSIPPGTRLKFRTKLGQSVEYPFHTADSVRLSISVKNDQGSSEVYSETGIDEVAGNCEFFDSCIDFRTRTADISEFWNQNVQLNIFAKSSYSRNAFGGILDYASQAWIDDIEFEPVPPNTSASPTAGLWFNPNRRSGGLNISRNNTGELLVVWYTYLPSGTPVWFMSNVEPMTGGTWVSAMLKGNRDPVSGTMVWQTVGTAELTMLDNDELIFTWDMNAQSGVQSAGAEKLFHLAGGGSFSGLYIEPAFPGWGINLDVQGSGSSATNVATVYFHTSGGQPIWAQGVESGDLMQSITFDMETFTGVCPGCSGQPASTTGTPAGTLSMRDFSTTSSNPRGYSAIETAGGVTWTRGSPSNLITFARLTKP